MILECHQAGQRLPKEFQRLQGTHRGSADTSRKQSCDGNKNSLIVARSPQGQGGGTRNHPHWYQRLHGFRIRVLCVLIALCIAPEWGFAQVVREIEVHRTSDDVRYGVIRDPGQRLPAPTLMVFAHGIEEMRKQPVYTEVARILAAKGWISVVVDPPCHGEDTRDGEPAQLDGWRHRLEAREKFVATFTAKASSVLDQLIQDGIADPRRLAACGTSRGGFLAYHFAAADPRIKAVAGISPVTRLTALREFSTTTHRDEAEQLNVTNLAPTLAGRAVWLSIGNNDARVNTDDAIEFTRAVVRASARPELPNAVIPVELLVAPTPGHSKIDQAHELLAVWFVNQFSANHDQTEDDAR